MEKDQINTKMTRRQVLKAGLVGGAGLLMPWKLGLTQAQAEALTATLSDPAMQPKFVNTVPNALDPGFKFEKNAFGVYRVGVGPTWQKTGLVNRCGRKLWTKLFGYGQRGRFTWPGKTFEVHRSEGEVKVNWRNQLFFRIISCRLAHPFTGLTRFTATKITA